MRIGRTQQVGQVSRQTNTNVSFSAKQLKEMSVEDLVRLHKYLEKNGNRHSRRMVEQELRHR